MVYHYKREPSTCHTLSRNGGDTLNLKKEALNSFALHMFGVADFSGGNEMRRDGAYIPRRDKPTQCIRPFRVYKILCVGDIYLYK